MNRCQVAILVLFALTANFVLADRCSATFVDPTSLTGVTLWLDANDATTITTDASGVNAWSDKSGLGNDVSQSTDAKKPHVSTGVFSNGKNALSFDGGDWIGNTGSSVIAPTSTANTMFIVAKRTTVAGYRVLFDVTQTGGNNAILNRVGYLSDSSTLVHRVRDNATPTTHTCDIGTTESLSSFSILATQRSSNTVELWDNGTSAGTNTNNSLSAMPSGDYYTTIGTLRNLDSPDGNTSWCITGLVAEVIVYNRALSTSECNQVGYYLAEKYGVSTTYTIPEPGSLSLLGGAGLAGLLTYAWRKRK